MRFSNSSHVHGFVRLNLDGRKFDADERVSEVQLVVVDGHRAACIAFGDDGRLGRSNVADDDRHVL